MTKLILMFSLCCTAVLAGESTERVKTIMLKECQEKTGASMVDLEAIKSRRLPQTQQGLCMLDCILNAVKILNNGKFSKAGMMLVFTPIMKGDISRLSKLKEFTEICEKDIGEDQGHCTTGKKVVECIAKHGKEYGVSIKSNSRNA